MVFVMDLPEVVKGIKAINAVPRLRKSSESKSKVGRPFIIVKIVRSGIDKVGAGALFRARRRNLKCDGTISRLISDPFALQRLKVSLNADMSWLFPLARVGARARKCCTGERTSH